MKTATLDDLYTSGLLSDLDLHFARFIARMNGGDATEASLAAAIVSAKRREGHICVDLRAFAGQAVTASHADAPVFPTLKEWIKILVQSSTIGSPGQYRPLILDGHLLYLYRYWDYEQRLAGQLKKMAAETVKAFDPNRMRTVLAELFPEKDSGEEGAEDKLKVAALTALRRRLCVITGGPGTGKTYTVARILALLLAQYGEDNGRIVLAAPTGKAAARLKESVKTVKAQLPCGEKIMKRIPEEASTIHRLLGSLPNSPYFRFNRENRLPADCVVIDEASMIDLALFSKLVDALKPSARLILLGDKNQLASVEAGAVLGDICDTGRVHERSGRAATEKIQLGKPTPEGKASDADGTAISACIVELTESYRFSKESGIGALSLAVNAGRSDQVRSVIEGADHDDLQWTALPQPDRLAGVLSDWVMNRYRPCFEARNPADVLAIHGQARILCALREGPYGVQAVNASIENILRKKGLIGRTGRWYPGRPVMITKNDYTLRLFNGDVGVALIDNADGALKVFFPEAEGAVRSFLPSRLPEHETVFAMTVHKSQGSEFDHVLFILPDRDAPILTRELIYTAVTRARRRIEIWGKKEIFLSAAERRIERSSGLRKALWEANGAES